MFGWCRCDSAGDGSEIETFDVGAQPAIGPALEKGVAGGADGAARAGLSRFEVVLRRQPGAPLGLRLDLADSTSAWIVAVGSPCGAGGGRGPVGGHRSSRDPTSSLAPRPTPPSAPRQVLAITNESQGVLAVLLVLVASIGALETPRRSPCLDLPSVAMAVHPRAPCVGVWAPSSSICLRVARAELYGLGPWLALGLLVDFHNFVRPPATAHSERPLGAPREWSTVPPAKLRSGLSRPIRCWTSTDAPRTTA